MSPHHLRILAALDTESDGCCLSFAGIASRGGGDDRRAIRRGARYLARQGMAEYHRGLWTEDGEPAGAGYGITPAGREALAKAKAEGRAP